MGREIIKSISTSVGNRFSTWREQRAEARLTKGLTEALTSETQRLKSRLDGRKPKVAIIKQDCNEDLYCCSPEAGVWETISSTLLRSGPVDLFTIFDARFFILKTEPDAECGIWKEKSDSLKWAPQQWFEEFRSNVPGREYGQEKFAISADDVKWADYDLVVSLDVSVPSRITRNFPNTAWSYYVREVKSPSWRSSFDQPIAGQDLYLSQRFQPVRPQSRPHVVDFPYQFQHVGVFHELALGKSIGADQVPRSGVFVEYHSALEATDDQLRQLSEFGPVYAHRPADQRFDQKTGQRIPDRTMAGKALAALLKSKYHVKWSGRPALGTAKVEAIAAGCLCATNRHIDGTPFLHTEASLADGFETLIQQLRSMENDPEIYQSELRRQRQLVDYLCYARPANDLLDSCERVLRQKRKI